MASESGIEIMTTSDARVPRWQQCQQYQQNRDPEITRKMRQAGIHTFGLVKHFYQFNVRRKFFFKFRNNRLYLALNRDNVLAFFLADDSQNCNGNH
jgi:Na+-translocating ferredoxin:NAD+ oxidoreductase RnfC subunit